MAPIHTIAALFAVLFSPVFVELCDCFLHPATHQIKHRCIPQLWSAPTALTEPNLTQPIKSTNVSIPNQTRLSEEQLSIRFGPAFAQKIIELAEYKEKFGDCLVPKRYQDNPSLGNFVNKQRQLYRKYLEGENTSMTQEKIEVLESLGFAFNTSSIPIRSHSSDRAWRKMYNQLAEYHKLHGHSSVPSNTSLGQWCVTQRYRYRLNGNEENGRSLSQDRIEMLDKLGFVFETRYEVLWDQRINELKEFKKLYGHCMVPRNYKPNPQLASWVTTQRKYYNLKKRGKKSYLTDERQKQLEAMDFVWSYWDYNFTLNGFK
ncbi:hypothetical protein ACHAWO_005159 [Cyclotella atomus]|uniref:Helicase-associated domain-containing protein n=1 Tax=Cyclotella atomus TaxID=382360 RepID=A0ABD3MXR6_9STRA